MKKYITTICIFLLIVLLCSCSPSEITSEESLPTTENNANNLCTEVVNNSTAFIFPNEFVLRSPTSHAYVGETFIGVELGVVCHPEFHQSDYKIEVNTDDSDIIEIIEVNERALLNLGSGVTMKALKAGTATLNIRITYLPTGMSATLQQTVIVSDPNATQPAETTP